MEPVKANLIQKYECIRSVLGHHSINYRSQTSDINLDVYYDRLRHIYYNMTTNTLDCKIPQLLVDEYGPRLDFSEQNTILLTLYPTCLEFCIIGLERMIRFKIADKMDLILRNASTNTEYPLPPKKSEVVTEFFNFCVEVKSQFNGDLNCIYDAFKLILNWVPGIDVPERQHLLSIMRSVFDYVDESFDILRDFTYGATV